MNPSKTVRSKTHILTDLSNIGPSIAEDLRVVGIQTPQDLVGKDPLQLYKQLNAITGIRHDPCVLDVFMSSNGLHVRKRAPAVVGLHGITQEAFDGRMPSMKFGYCIFYVDSVEKTLKFFEDAFHQNRRFLHDSGMYGELDTGSTVLAFASHEMGDANLNGNYARTTATDKPFGMELAFVVDDVPSAYAHAVACGAIPTAEPKTKPWGQTVGYVRTPDGILIERCTPIGG